MVDFDRLLRLDNEEKELDNYRFLDVDDEDHILELIELVKDIEGIYIRRSANNHLHVAIPKDEYPGLNRLCDENYDGFGVFYNKGKKWSSPVWECLATGKYREFRKSIIIHVFVKAPIDEPSGHVYFKEKKVVDAVKYLMEMKEIHEHVYFTFNVATVKFKDKKSVENGIYDNKNEEELKDEYMKVHNFKEFIDNSQFHNILFQFKRTIPDTFKDVV